MAKLQIDKIIPYYLLRDMLPRIPYNLKVWYDNCEYTVKGYKGDNLLILAHESQIIEVKFFEVKPILRTMTSMSKEELDTFHDYINRIDKKISKIWETTSWLSQNMFDYNDLIGMGKAVNEDSMI